MQTATRLLVTCCCLIVTTSAQAGGLWIRDFGTTAQGRANAGEAAGVESAGTVAHNPAGMSLLEQSEFAASAFALYGDIEFDIDSTTPPAGSNEGGTIGETAPAGGFGYAYKINERWTAGLGASQSHIQSCECLQHNDLQPG